MVELRFVVRELTNRLIHDSIFSCWTKRNWPRLTICIMSSRHPNKPIKCKCEPPCAFEKKNIPMDDNATLVPFARPKIMFGKVSKMS